MEKEWKTLFPLRLRAFALNFLLFSDKGAKELSRYALN